MNTTNISGSVWDLPETIYHHLPVVRATHCQISFLELNKGKLITIGVLASIAIGALIGGGVCFTLNTCAAWSCLGGGSGLILIVMAIGGILLYRKLQHQQAEAGPTVRLEAREYTILSCKVEETEREQLNSCWDNPRDIMCFQNSGKIDFKELPSGYDSFSYQTENQDDHNCTIVWNVSKFSKVAHARVAYPESVIGSGVDTIILLKDKKNEITICVASVHLPDVSTENKDHKLIKRGEASLTQLLTDLKIVEESKADLHILAGNCDVTHKDDEVEYESGLEVIRNYEYVMNRSKHIFINKKRGTRVYSFQLKTNQKEENVKAPINNVSEGQFTYLLSSTIKVLPTHP